MNARRAVAIAVLPWISTLSISHADDDLARRQLSVHKYDLAEVRHARQVKKTIKFPMVKVDVIELNHVQGKMQFDQLLFWSKYPDGELHVRHWTLVRSKHMMPKRQGDHWVTSWEREGIVYTVAAPTFHKTTGMVDPELLDREGLAKVDRLPLWFPKQRWNEFLSNRKQRIRADSIGDRE